MKHLTILCLFTCLISTAFGQKQLPTPQNALKKFEQFKKKEKFLPEQPYPGIADNKLKPILTEKINQAAEDFRTLAKTSKATEKDYQNKIKIGLERFSKIEIDTEDRERICTYFEELMDIVGLESSGGHLNKFMYGFDPTQKQ